MANFTQICKIKTSFKEKKPEMIIKENNFGKFLNGKIQWADGKDNEGKTNYTWFYFFTKNEEIIELITSNPQELFLVKGFLKNRKWKDKQGNWKGEPEIYITNAEIYQKEKQEPVPSFHETDNDEIIF